MNDPTHSHTYQTPFMSLGSLKAAYITDMKSDIYDLVCNPPVCLAPCKAECPAPTKKGWKKQEEENLMNYASASISTPATETQDQRKYLARRLDETYRNLRDPLEATFGLIDDDMPSTLQELKDRIEGGKFTFRDEKDVQRYHYWTDMIKWRDPAKKADQAGYDAAKKDLKAKYQTALDAVKIKAPDTALEVIIDLEKWTPTGAAN